MEPEASKRHPGVCLVIESLSKGEYSKKTNSPKNKVSMSLSKKYKWKTKQNPQNPQTVCYSPAYTTKSGGEQSPAD